jgi:hypothetical protein
VSNRFEIEWIVEGHPRFDRNRNQPPLVMVHIDGEDMGTLKLSVMNIKEADAAVVSAVERQMPPLYELDPTTTCTRVPGAWMFALRHRDAAPPPIGPAREHRGLAGDLLLCQVLVDRMFGKGTFFVRQWARDETWYCSITDEQWQDAKATVSNPSRRGAELVMLAGMCEALKISIMQEMENESRNIVGAEAVKQAVEHLERSKRGPTVDTVCANCGAPFAPPPGLFGTNDCICTQCDECYTAVLKADFDKGKPS